MDEAEFERWYRSEHPRMVSALTAAAGDAGIGREVTDEAFARAYERWGRVRTMASPGGWTYRTAVNVLRRRQRRASLEQRLLSRGTQGDDPPVDWSAELWDLLRSLPDRERMAIALRYVADLTTDEIAVAMRVAPGTVGSTLHNARVRLAGLLGDDLPLDTVASDADGVPPSRSRSATRQGAHDA